MGVPGILRRHRELSVVLRQIRLLQIRVARRERRDPLQRQQLYQPILQRPFHPLDTTFGPVILCLCISPFSERTFR